MSKNLRITFLIGMGSPFDSKQYSRFQVNIFSNDRDIRKCQSSCTMTPTRSLPLPPPTRKGYDNTSTFCSKTAEIKMGVKIEKHSFPFRGMSYSQHNQDILI